jgi:hypothetical protein
MEKMAVSEVVSEANVSVEGSVVSKDEITRGKEDKLEISSDEMDTMEDSASGDDTQKDEIEEVEEIVDYKVFLQGEAYWEEGAASYHIYFSPERERSYISFENAPSFWKMSNGQSPPDRKYFENETYDAETRTFKGTITWAPLTFAGDSTYEFTLHFDEDFTMITAENSCMVAKNAEGEINRTYKYETDLTYR